MNRLKEFRQKANLSQDELGKALGGWVQSRICNYERGRIPSLNDCRQIVRVLNERGVECTIDDVFPPESEAA